MLNAEKLAMLKELAEAEDWVNAAAVCMEGMRMALVRGRDCLDPASHGAEWALRSSFRQARVSRG